MGRGDVGAAAGSAWGRCGRRGYDAGAGPLGGSTAGQSRVTAPLSPAGLLVGDRRRGRGVPGVPTDCMGAADSRRVEPTSKLFSACTLNVYFLLLSRLGSRCTRVPRTFSAGRAGVRDPVVLDRRCLGGQLCPAERDRPVADGGPCSIGPTMPGRVSGVAFADAPLQSDQPTALWARTWERVGGAVGLGEPGEVARRRGRTCASLPSLALSSEGVDRRAVGLGRPPVEVDLLAAHGVARARVPSACQVHPGPTTRSGPRPAAQGRTCRTRRS